MIALAKRGSTKILDDGSVAIPLTSGELAVVDAIDADIAEFPWKLHEHGYAVRRLTKGSRPTHARLHRVVLERTLGRPLLASELVDHVDGDKLNNRRCNLRIATSLQNAHNYGKYLTNATSDYKGVCFDRGRKKFKAEIRYDQARWHIGRFETQEEAAWMYDQWASQLHGDFAYLNFQYSQ